MIINNTAMSLAHLTVNGAVLALRPLHKGASDDFLPHALPKTFQQVVGGAPLAAVDQREPRDEANPPLGSGFAFEPVGAEGAFITHRRGAVSRMLVRGAVAELHLSMRHGRGTPETFHTRDIVRTWVAVSKFESNSVVANIESRTLWEQVRSSVYVPGGTGSTESSAIEAVRRGEHVDVLAARLVAFALEHALCPFVGRLRAPEPNSTYFWKNQPQRDPNQWSLQRPEAFEDFLGGTTMHRQENTLRQVAYVGPAAHLQGMALLASLGRDGGPVFGQTAELLAGFTEDVHVLLVGDQPLANRWPNVESDDFGHAIREAEFLLTEYNGVTPERLGQFQSALINNLILLDTTMHREVPQMGGFDYAQPNIVAPVRPDGMAGEAVVDAVVDGLDAPTLHALPRSSQRDWYNPCLRRQMALIAPNANQLGDPRVTRVPAHTARLLMAGANPAVVHDGALGAYPAETSIFDARQLEGLGIQVPHVAFHTDAVTAAFSALSGRSPFWMFTHLPPPIAGVAAQPIPVGLGAALNAGQLDFGLLPAVGAASVVQLVAALERPIPPGTTWHRVTQFDGMEFQGRDFILVYFEPAFDSMAPNTWVPLMEKARRFDLRREVMQVQLGSPEQENWLRVHARSIHRVATQQQLDPAFGVLVRTNVDADGTPIQTPIARWGTFLQALGQLWWNANTTDRLAQAERQMRARHALGEVPNRSVLDETLLYLGGLKNTLTLSSNGGLWVMFYLPVAQYVHVPQNSAFLQDLSHQQHLAEALIVARSSVEAALYVLGVGEKRIQGNIELVEAGLPDPVARYLTLRSTQNLVGDTASSFGTTVITLRALKLGDPVAFRLLNAKLTFAASLHVVPLRNQLLLDEEFCFHYRFVRPHVLSRLAVAQALGVAYPTYVPANTVAIWLERVAWNGQVKHLDGVDFPFVPYRSDARIDTLFFRLVANLGHHFIVDKWAPKGAPVDQIVQVPLHLFTAGLIDVPLLETRLAFPFHEEVRGASWPQILPVAGATRNFNIDVDDDALWHRLTDRSDQWPAQVRIWPRGRTHYLIDAALHTDGRTGRFIGTYRAEARGVLILPAAALAMFKDLQDAETASARAEGAEAAMNANPTEIGHGGKPPTVNLITPGLVLAQNVIQGGSRSASAIANTPGAPNPNTQDDPAARDALLNVLMGMLTPEQKAALATQLGGGPSGFS